MHHTAPHALTHLLTPVTVMGNYIYIYIYIYHSFNSVKCRVVFTRSDHQRIDCSQGVNCAALSQHEWKKTQVQQQTAGNLSKSKHYCLVVLLSHSRMQHNSRVIECQDS